MRSLVEDNWWCGGQPVKLGRKGVFLVKVKMREYLNLKQSYPEKMGAKGYIAHMRLLDMPNGTSGPMKGWFR